jgi:creatinine amidohydrolase
MATLMNQRSKPAEYSVFAGTMADMTYTEVEAAARAGAIVLWGLGVIEEHGPHLPLGTDVYIPSAVLREVRALLTERGRPSVIVPPFYWGVNAVTGQFPGTFHVRPEIMTELMLDVFASLKKDGFDNVFCLSGHGDIAHIRVIHAAVQLGRARYGVASSIVVTPAAEARLTGGAPDPSVVAIRAPDETPSKFLDIHAGEWETSQIWATYPGLVRQDIVRGLKSTDLGPSDLEVWRRGAEHARRTTPEGYFGDPAAADPARGRRQLEQQALAIAEAVIARRDADG